MTTFLDFAGRVLEMRQQDGIRGIAHERNRFTTHLVGAPFAAKELGDITAVDLRDWIREMQAKMAADTRETRKLATDTVKRCFSLVSTIFTVALERDLIKASPAFGVRVKRRADETATKEKWAYLTREEQLAVFRCKAIPYADRLAIRFAVGTGLRQGEQFNLLLQDLHTDGDEPFVWVRFGSPNLPPKSGKPRRVPLLEDALIAAKLWEAERPLYAPKNPLGLAFPSQRGTRRSIGKPLGNRATLKAHLAHVGITRRVRWHDLRHTAATNLVTGALGRRWTLEEVKPFMGHSSVTISERYAHVGDDALKAAARETMLARCGPIAEAPDTVRDVTEAAS